jgi:hypothetical protein
VTWKVYNIGWDSVPYGNTDNVFVFWERWAHDKRTLGTKGSFFNDLRRGRLPQVSWIIPSYARGWDEHPPADVSIGMGIQEELVTALRESSAWDSSCGVRKVGSRCKSEYFVSRTEFYAPHRVTRRPARVPQRRTDVERRRHNPAWRSPTSAATPRSCSPWPWPTKTTPSPMVPSRTPTR